MNTKRFERDATCLMALFILMPVILFVSAAAVLSSPIWITAELLSYAWKEIRKDVGSG